MTIKEIRNKLFWKFYFYKNKAIASKWKRKGRISPRHNLIISSSGRSGSTWLTELISNQPGFTAVHEPLKNSNSYKVQNLGFTGWSQYIPENERWDEVYNFFQDLFHGQELNPNYFYNYTLSKHTTVLVQRFIRLHHMLPWIVKKFNTPKPIHIIRNPFAVIASQMNHVGFAKGKIWKPEMRNFPPMPHYDHYYRHLEKYFRRVNSKAEQLAIHWCFQNKAVLHHSNNNHEWATLDYESLITKPEEIPVLVEDVTGFKLNEKILDHVRKSSYSTIDSQGLDDPEIQLNKWKKKLKKEEVIGIQKIIKLMDFEIYSPEDPYIIDKDLIYSYKDSN